jgi:hypothetical protein
MKKALFLALLSILVFSSELYAQTSVWTKDYEQTVTVSLDKFLKPRVADDQKRKDLVAYTVKRYKEQLPDGISSVTADSLDRLGAVILREYVASFPKIFDVNKDFTPTLHPWNKFIEDELRTSILMKLTAKEKLKGKAICDCFIVELKKTYPDSIIIPIPNDVMRKASVSCYRKLHTPKSKKN